MCCAEVQEGKGAEGQAALGSIGSTLHSAGPHRGTLS